MSESRGAAAKEMSSGLGGVTLVAFAASVIGLSFVLARPVYDAGSNPLTVIALRYPATVLMLALALRLRGRSLVLARRELATSYGVGLAYFVATGSYLASIFYLPVSLAVLLFYSYPLLTVVFESLLQRRLPRPLDVAAFVAAFAGLALALEVSFAALDPRGIALALLGAVAAAGTFVWTGRALAAADMTVVTFHLSVCGSAVSIIALIASGSYAPPANGFTGWLVMAAVILLFGVGFVAMFTGVKLIGALRTSMVMNLEPIATIALAVLILGEAFTLQQVAGAALVFGAIIVTQRRKRAPGTA